MKKIYFLTSLLLVGLFSIAQTSNAGRTDPAAKKIAATPEYDVLVYVANWPAKRSHAWKTLLQARAIENQCYVIGVNRTGRDGNDINHSGDSMVIDPLGEVLYHKTNEEDVHTISLDKQHLEEIRNKFPFWKDADPFIIPSIE